MEPVLGLVEHNRVAGLEDLVGHLEAIETIGLEDLLADRGVAVVERRQAVHEPHVRVLRTTHDVHVHLIGLEQVDALLPHALLLTHRHPHVGVEEVDPSDAFVDVLGQRQLGAGLFCDVPTGLHQLVRGPQVLRRAQPHVHAELAATDHERVPHVVAGVPEIAVRDLGEWLLAGLRHGHHVGEDLGGVELVGEPVPHRHSGVLGQDLDLLLAEPSVLDAVVGAPQHPSGVLHRLLVADLRAAGVEVGDVGTLVIGGHLERGPGPGRGLLEDERDVLVGQVWTLIAAVLGRLQVRGQSQQELELGRGEVEFLQEAAVAEVERHVFLLQ